MRDFAADIVALFGPHPDLKQLLLIGLTPVFVAAVLVEHRALRAQSVKAYEWRDVLTNLGLGGSYQAVEVLYHALFLGAVFAWVYELRVATIEMNWVTWPLLIVALDFVYYGFHRASHRIRWFWCAHVVHHSSERMNMTTAMRQSLTYSLNLSHLFWVPLMLVGFPPGAVMLALAINLAFQFFVHTEAMRRLPRPIEWLFNTPSHHRVHHGRNTQYLDRNYGGMLIVWDRLFGTFEPESEPVEYGIRRPIASHDIVRLNFHEWIDMFRDALSPGPWRLRVKHLWAPPEWRRPEPEDPNA